MKATPYPMLRVLNLTALTTLKHIEEDLTYKVDGIELTDTWSNLYWQGKILDKDNFGSYGSLGNRFAETDVRTPLITLLLLLSS